MNRFLKKSEEHLKANEKARKYQAKIQQKVGVYRNSFKAQNHFTPRDLLIRNTYLCLKYGIWHSLFRSVVPIKTE